MMGSYLHTARFIKCVTLLFFACLALNACDNAEIKENVRKTFRDPIDREADVTYDEFKETMRPLGSAEKRAQKKDRPQHEDDEELDFSPVILAPEEPEIKSAKLVSLSITPDVQIKDVLLEVGRQAKLDMAIDPNIGDGGIYLSVKDRPVGDVIKMICTLAELKYDIEDSVLRVERDRPYLENYAVDFINLVRSTDGSVSTSTSVLSISTGGGSSGLTSGSSNKIQVKSDGDLWKAIEDNLDKILSKGTVATTAEADNALQADAIAANAGGGDNQLSLTSGNQGSRGGNNRAGAAARVGNNANRQSANTTQARAAASASSDSNRITLTESDADLGGYYTINRQAGIISVMATQKKHRAIQKYLEHIKKSLSSQVLIEAKVLEVSLADQYGSGITWQDLVNTANGKPQSFNVSGDSAAGSGSPISSPALTTGIFNNILTFSGASPIGKQRLKYIADLIQQYGTTRALSNPRITALNNQQAVLTFAVNQPYYTVTITAATNTNNNNGNSQTTPPTASSTVHSVPIGVILTLYPLIHMDTGEVTLNIRPTISTNTGQNVPDPAISILAAGLASTGSSDDMIKLINANNKGVPTVQVRELDTVLKIKSGDVIVLGGLIQNTDQNVDSGIPFLSKIPILGNLAKKTYKSTTVKETVILLQATILSSDGYTHEHDRKLYNTLAQDPRPITF